MIRIYSDLIKIKTFDERFDYLKLNGKVGVETFGFDRFFNQKFYMSKEWKDIRNYVIVRDNGCDLGVEGYDITGNQKIFIHHMNPICINDINDKSDILLNPDYLITTTFLTHNAIHYGDKNILASEPIVRLKNDTCPWRNTT